MERIILKLDRVRTLKFNISAARQFKAAYGKPLYLVRLILGTELEMLDHDCLVHVLWAGLVHEDRRLTVDRITQLLDEHLEQGGKLQEIYDPIAEAFRSSGLFSDMEGKAPVAGAPETGPPAVKAAE